MHTISSTEIHVYTEDDIVKLCGDKIRDLYSEMKSAVLGLGTDITIHPTKKYIVFLRNHPFIEFHPSKSKLRLDFGIKIAALDDPKKIARGVKQGNWSAITITESSEIPMLYLTSIC